MLKMLMKYEWKYIWKKALLFAGLLLLATVIGMFAASQLAELSDTDRMSGLLGALLGYMLYYTVLVGSILGLILIIAIRFYRSVFSSAGYVTNTLPASGRQIYGAHLIVYGITYFVFTWLVFGSIMLVTNRVVTGIAVSMDMGAEMFGSYGPNMFGFDGPAEIALLAVYTAIATITSLLMIYASIVLGQSWKKHKVWGAVVSYIVISVTMMIVTSIVLFPYMIGSIMMNPASPTLGTSFWVICLVIVLIYGAATLWITDRGMTKRLNLE
ncbi:MAG: hypothetical protein K6E16_07845 [Lachnospiraceae bacterium]|nr:hypothetical protein [Lachnospiraceae bacterium]